MKNLTKNAGLLFIALGALCVTSCTKNDDVVPGKANVETTKVAFNVNADNDVSGTGKLIDRNAAPLYVDNLTITGTCNGYGFPFVATENFTFGPGGAGVPTGFSLANVALGINTFNAVSLSSNDNKKLGWQNIVVQGGLDVMKAHTPYINCASNSVQATIVKGQNAPIALNMTTNNGRVLAKFVKETPDADNYLVRITATQGDFTATESEVANTTGPKYFEWSNENCIDGATITFTIRIYEKGQGNIQGALLNTIVKTITVQKAKNIMATYTIHNTDVHEDIVDGGIVLTFPTIEDVIINE